MSAGAAPAARRGRTLRLPLASAPPPGRVGVVHAEGVRVGLVWVDGELHALADACPHRGAPICSAGQLVPVVSLDGERALIGEADHVRCPWHRWDFDVRTGACRGAPHLRLKRFEVAIDGEEIAISLSPARGAGAGTGEGSAQRTAATARAAESEERRR
jgi:nitrite reductase/ring-hydroxylating ferredoxin subunit